MSKFIIKYDYCMGHEYRGYICKDVDGKFIEFCEDDGCSEKDAFRFDTKEDAVLTLTGMPNTDTKYTEIIEVRDEQSIKQRKIVTVKTTTSKEYRAVFNHFFVGKVYDVSEVMNFLIKKGVNPIQKDFEIDYEKSGTKYQTVYERTDKDGIVKIVSVKSL